MTEVSPRFAVSQSGEAAPLGPEGEYRDLVEQAEAMLPEGVQLDYVPSDGGFNTFGIGNEGVDRLSLDDLRDRLTHGEGPVGVAIISREHIHLPDSQIPANAPWLNAELTPSSAENTDRGLEVWDVIKDLGAERQATIIPAGRAHAGKLRAVARLLYGVSGSPDATAAVYYDIASEVDTSRGLYPPDPHKSGEPESVVGLTADDFASRLEQITAGLSMPERRQFVERILGKEVISDTEVNPLVEEAEQVLRGEFQALPQVSEARLMANLLFERLAARGESLESNKLVVEETSWDSITQVVMLRAWAEEVDARDMIIVVGEDQLPRVAVLAAEIFEGLPVQLTLVGTQPHLGDVTEGNVSQIGREAASMVKGRNWVREIKQQVSSNTSEDGSVSHQIMRLLVRNPKSSIGYTKDVDGTIVSKGPLPKSEQAGWDAYLHGRVNPQAAGVRRQKHER